MSNPYQLSLWDARESLFLRKVFWNHSNSYFYHFLPFSYICSMFKIWISSGNFLLKVFCKRKWQMLALYLPTIVSTLIMQTFILKYIWQILRPNVFLVSHLDNVNILNISDLIFFLQQKCLLSLVTPVDNANIRSFWIIIANIFSSTEMSLPSFSLG